MTRFLLILALALCIGCKQFSKEPLLSYSYGNGVFIQHEGAKALDLLAVNTLYRDTVKYFSLTQSDTLRGLECKTKYLFYYRYADQQDYSFLDTINFEPFPCRRELTFSQTDKTNAGGNFLMQDILQGSIYTVGEHGKLVYELESTSGLMRGFDLQDSLLVWISDSSQLTIKNLMTAQRRVIDTDSTIKLHHDVVVHYPYVTALYNRKNDKEIKSHKATEEGLWQINLQTGDIKLWSILDFVSTLPLGNTKGSQIVPHGNSVDVDQNNDYYISFRDLNQVWKISPDFSTVHYTIGMNATLSKSGGDDFVGQHSVDIISPDVFYLFDNGSVDQRTAKSKIVKVSVNPSAQSFTVQNILTLPDSLSTGKMGSVHALGDRLLISTYNKKFHVLEIDTAGTLKNHLTSSKSNAIKILPVRSIQKY